MRYRYVHILAAFFLVVGMAVQFIFSYHRASTRVQERMDLEMQVAQEKLLFELYDAYEAVTHMKEYITDEMTCPEDLLNATWETVKRYPHFFTSYVAYPPYAFPDKGKWYCLSSYRVHDSIISSVFGDEKHDYFQHEWYDGAIQSGESGYWTQPYNDDEFDEPIFTYANDYRDKNGKLVCVICVDFSVKWVQQMLEQFKPFGEAVFALYSSTGTLLTSSDNLNTLELEESDSKGVFNEQEWVVSRKTLKPIDIDMVMAVPETYVWRSIRVGILVPFSVFVLGILVVAFFIRRILRDEKENARLGTEKEVMDHELQIAHDIQMGILKNKQIREKSEINVAGVQDIDLHAILLPMHDVGGDLFDFHREGDTLWFIIGDVTGKGVPAAMFMSATVNLFRAIGMRSNSPKQIVEEMNLVLSENNPSLTFVTAFVGRLHITSGELLYCNAGHCAPLIQGAKSDVRYLPVEPNIPLGYDGTYEFLEQGCMLGEGERMVLYTDGVSEARNSKREMLGQKRLAELVTSGNDILSALKQYIGSAEPTDDITLMTIRKISPVQPITLRVVNHEDQWPILRRAIHDFGICIGIEKRTLKKLELAAEEAVVNIVRYSGASEIALTLSHSPFTITLSDDGIAFDPTAYEINADAVEKRQIGGLGISLIRQIADELRYEYTNNKNQLTILKHI